jgi:hypothetical protein
MLIRPTESLSERNEAAIVAFSHGGTRVGKHCHHVSPVAWRGPLQVAAMGIAIGRNSLHIVGMDQRRAIVVR